MSTSHFGGRSLLKFVAKLSQHVQSRRRLRGAAQGRHHQQLRPHLARGALQALGVCDAQAGQRRVPDTRPRSPSLLDESESLKAGCAHIETNNLHLHNSNWSLATLFGHSLGSGPNALLHVGVELGLLRVLIFPGAPELVAHLLGALRQEVVVALTMAHPVDHLAQ